MWIWGGGATEREAAGEKSPERVELWLLVFGFGFVFGSGSVWPELDCSKRERSVGCCLYCLYQLLDNARFRQSMNRRKHPLPINPTKISKVENLLAHRRCLFPVRILRTSYKYGVLEYWYWSWYQVAQPPSKPRHDVRAYGPTTDPCSYQCYNSASMPRTRLVHTIRRGLLHPRVHVPCATRAGCAPAL
jgi:hypothetical protein